MKKTILLVLLMAFTVVSFSQTANEVINKFMAASGGKDKLNSINTLQYSQIVNVKSPMGNIDIPMQYFKEKNKFYRMQALMNFNGQFIKFFTLVSDTGGYVMVPAMPMLGSEGGLSKLSDNDRKMQAYQLDAAGYFASLVDYAAKRSRVELLKDEKVNNQDCYQIKLTLSTGQPIVYFINKTTNLVTRVDTKGDMAAGMSGLGSMAGGLGASMSMTALYSNYQDFGGIKFPTKVVTQTQMGESESTIANVKINEAIDEKYYRPE